VAIKDQCTAVSLSAIPMMGVDEVSSVHDLHV